MLKFSPANSKIKKLYKIESLKKFLAKRKIYSFDLSAGHSCPFAKLCFSRAIQSGNKLSILDGPDTEFRCYAASQEVIYPNVYRLRSDNFNALKKLTYKQMVNLISSSIPKNAGVIRIHSSGDFFNKKYWAAWMKVIRNRPDILFYAYTKALQYWVDTVIPTNLLLTASYGGKHDHLIKKYNLRYSKVIKYPEETTLEIDDDDSHAADPSKVNQNFALLVHGVQPKGTEYSKAVYLRLQGKNGKVVS